MNETEKQPKTKPGRQDDGHSKPEKEPKKPDAQKADGTPDWDIDPKTQQ